GTALNAGAAVAPVSVGTSVAGTAKDPTASAHVTAHDASAAVIRRTRRAWSNIVAGLLVTSGPRPRWRGRSANDLKLRPARPGRYAMHHGAGVYFCTLAAPPGDGDVRA